MVATRLGAQQTITGRVTENGSGLPLSGVRVAIDDAQSADTTRNEGTYRLSVPDGRAAITLRLTKIGFGPVSRRVAVAAGRAGSENFQLERRALGLDAIVVTGSAGATQVREVGHSIAEIRPSTLAEPIVSVDHLLSAKVPGLMVIPSTGMAGSGREGQNHPG